jgi:hypothetical protein
MTANHHQTGPRDVSQNQTTQPLRTRQRQATLSPELRELLHMLKSLETELDTPPPAAR